MNVLIGSRAYSWWDTSREIDVTNRDWDIITDEEWEYDPKIEIHHADEYLSRTFAERYTSRASMEINGRRVFVMTLPGLAAIKRSHLSLNHNWIKHISFYHKYLKRSLSPADMPLVKEREKITLEKAKQRAPTLNKSNDAFFDDYVEKKYDHDYLHELVAWYDKPLYTRLKQEGNEESAWCEKDLWNSFSSLDKLRCVSEECHVIAIERFLIPSEWKVHPAMAYNKALQKVCTTLTSGWFRDYAIDYWPELRKMMRKETIDKVRQTLGE